MKAAEKRVALAAIADGRAGLVVGTHAVLTDSVVFKNLGLAIVDEQHRFGVRQRGILAGKANNPHLLVMSATPIPRTLGLLMYGDLDISILDELPPGRKPIKTWFITGKKRRDMYGFLEKQIAAGHQVYIVCPAIEENEMDSGMKAVKQYYELSLIHIFNGIPSFGGTWEGQNHAITGLSLSQDGSVQGLFRYVQQGALVRDMTVKGRIKPGGTRASVGGIAGSNAGTDVYKRQLL